MKPVYDPGPKPEVYQERWYVNAGQACHDSTPRHGHDATPRPAEESPITSSPTSTR